MSSSLKQIISRWDTDTTTYQPTQAHSQLSVRYHINRTFHKEPLPLSDNLFARRTGLNRVLGG